MYRLLQNDRENWNISLKPHTSKAWSNSQLPSGCKHMVLEVLTSSVLIKKYDIIIMYNCETTIKEGSDVIISWMA